MGIGKYLGMGILGASLVLGSGCAMKKSEGFVYLKETFGDVKTMSFANGRIVRKYEAAAAPYLNGARGLIMEARGVGVDDAIQTEEINAAVYINSDFNGDDFVERWEAERFAYEIGAASLKSSAMRGVSKSDLLKRVAGEPVEGNGEF